MDLSKAFDCLPHDLMLLKLGCYGVSEQALGLTKDYFSNRKQRVKLGSHASNLKAKHTHEMFDITCLSEFVET